MIPRNIDERALLEVVFGPDLDQAFERWFADFEARLGPQVFQELRQDFEGFIDLLQQGPAQMPEVLDGVFERWAPILGTPLREAAETFVGRFRLPAERFEDFGVVLSVLMLRRAVRERNDNPGMGRAYAFFKDCYAIRPREMWRATIERRRREIDAAGDPQAQERYALQDLEVLLDLPRALEGDSLARASRSLHTVWCQAYERPVHRVAVLLWLFGQECRGVDGALKSLPSKGAGAVGEIFAQARKFVCELGLTFPFEPRLNAIRNALHGRQTSVRLDGTIEFIDQDRTAIATFTFEELFDLASKDVEFAVVADQALVNAWMTTADERGLFDEAWARLQTATAAITDPAADSQG